MEVYIIYTTTYVCKQRVVALLLMELLSKMRNMRTITPPDAMLIGRAKLTIIFHKIRLDRALFPGSTYKL